MTYCVGWKSSEGVFIIADSALSSDEPFGSRIKFSSFGELHEIQGKKYVEEMVIKIVKISDDCVIAYSTNDIKKAIKLINEIKNYYNDLDLRQILESLLITNGIVDHTSLIVGNFRNNNFNIFSYQNGILTNHNDYDIVQIGSLNEPYRTTTKMNLTELKTLIKNNATLNNEQILLYALSIIQNLGVRNNLMAKYVGGAFFGVFINPDGVNWQPDMSYILCTNDMNSFDMITLIFRDDIAFIQSSFQEESILAFCNDDKNSTLQNKLKTLKVSELNDEFFNLKEQYFIIINKQNNSIVILDKTSILKNNFYSISNDSDSLNIAFRKDLLDILNNISSNEIIIVQFN